MPEPRSPDDRAGVAPDGVLHPLIGSVSVPALHVMTFNTRRPVRWALRRADRWQLRREPLRRLVAAERPHVLAAQEVTAATDEALRAALGARYVRLGHGRNANRGGEMNPLYIDETRVRVEKHEQLALSPASDRQGSRGWGSVFPRVAVVARLTDRETGVAFTAVGTHFDHVSGWARRESARLIGEVVAMRGEPAVVMGDLNAAPGSRPLDALARAGLVDAWERAAERATPEYGTRAAYRAGRAAGRRIDHILVTPDIGVDKVGINVADVGGAWASDHLPVHAVLGLPIPGAAA